MEVRKGFRPSKPRNRRSARRTGAPSWYILTVLAAAGDWMTVESVIGAVWEMSPIMRRINRRGLWYVALAQMTRSGIVARRSVRGDRQWLITDVGLDVLSRSPIPRVEVLRRMGSDK